MAVDQRRDARATRAQVAAVLALLAVAGTARASSGGVSGSAAANVAGPRPPKRVLLIVDHPADAFAERIRAEVEGLGLKTVVVEAWREPERAEPMDAAARDQRASAAIRLVPSRRGVEIWMADETSGRSLLRQLIVDDNPSGPDENLVAMQLVELLRTSLLSAPPPPPPSPPPPPPPQIEQPVTPREPAACDSPACLRAQAGVGALTGFGGTGVALQAWLSLQTMLGGRLGLALDLGAPVTATTISGVEGSATLRAYLLGIAALMRLDDGGSRLSATAGAGLELVRVATRGSTEQPMLTAASESLFTAAGYLRLDGGVDLTRWLRIVLRVTAAVALDEVEIRFAGNQAADWGRFFGAGMLLLDAGRR